jgi:hypothetical protein
LPKVAWAAKLGGVVSPVAIYILAICFAGALLAGGAFVWAVLRGEFADAGQTALLVFDEEDEGAGAGPPSAPPVPGDQRPSERV